MRLIAMMWKKFGSFGLDGKSGTLWSSDNFYLLSSGLVVVDTQLEILNPKVYDRIPDFPSNPKIPNFMHVMTCNRMAGTGNHWTSLFAERNSGTGNAQWMVVDYNVFLPNEPLKDNTVWLVEQVPGVTEQQDISGVLRNKGYFASYNRPYFTQIRDETGHTAAEARHGTLYSYAKVVNRCLLRQMQAQAISGPTHASQKVFEWVSADGKDLWPGWPHLGLPDKWDFDWVQMTPTGTMALHDVQC